MDVGVDTRETHCQYILSHKMLSALSESDQGEIKDERTFLEQQRRQKGEGETERSISLGADV